MILPFQAASAVATGLYGISLEESLFNLINENNGKIIGDPTSLGFIVLPNDPVPTTDYGGTAMSIHSDGRFFASLFDSAIGDQTEPTLSVIDSNLVVTPSADFIKDGSGNILPIDGLAFDSSDTLYGVTIDGSLAGALYTLPLDGSAATFICNLPTPSDTTEAIAFNSADVLFHIFGVPPVLQTVDFSTNPCTVTNISLSQSISGDFFESLTFSVAENGFLGTTANGRLYSVSQAGEITNLNPDPGDDLPEIGGLALFDPSAVPSDIDNDGIPDNIEQTLDPNGGDLTVNLANGVSDASFEIDPTGEVTIEGSDSGGNTVFNIELPPDSSSNGQINLSYQTISGLSVAVISGVDASANYQTNGGKTITFATSSSSADRVCFVDRSSVAGVISFTFGYCPTRPSSSIVSMDCAPGLVEKDVSGFPEAPTSRHYECEVIDINGQNFLQVSGLAFSEVGEFLDLDKDNFYDGNEGEIIDSDTSGKQKVWPGETLTIKNGATLTGNVKVDGGTLNVRVGSTVNGKITSENGGQLNFQDNCTINGNIKATNSDVLIDKCSATGHVRTNGGSLIITNDSTVNGNVNAKNADSVTITDNNNSFNQHLRVEGTDTVTISNNSVDKNLRVKTSGQVTITDNVVGGHLRSFDNSQATITGNDVKGNLNTRGTDIVTVNNNHVGENLRGADSLSFTSMGNTVEKNLRVNDSFGVTIDLNQVDKNLRVLENNGVSVTGNIVGKNLNIKDNISCTYSGNTVNGKEKVKACDEGMP